MVTEVLKNKNLHNTPLGNITGNRFCASESEAEVRHPVKSTTASTGIKKRSSFCPLILNLYIKMTKIFPKSPNTT